MHAALTANDSVSLATYLAEVYELGWVLDSTLDRVLLREAKRRGFLEGGDWMCALAQEYGYRGDTSRARVYADSAHVAYAVVLKGLTRGPRGLPIPPAKLAFDHVFDGLALAYLGKRDSAVAQTKLADALIGGRSYDSYVLFTEAKIYVLLDQPQDALDVLERIVAPPDVRAGDRILEPFYTPAYLRLDRNFARLHGNPRFERLIAQSQ